MQYPIAIRGQVNENEKQLSRRKSNNDKVNVSSAHYSSHFIRSELSLLGHTVQFHIGNIGDNHDLNRSNLDHKVEKFFSGDEIPNTRAFKLWTTVLLNEV
jgi:hypothetical protein